MRDKIKLFIDPSNIIRSPNIGPILGQKGINIKLFINLLSIYFLKTKLKLLFSCILYIVNKKIVSFVIKKPSIFILLKYFLNVNSFNNIEFISIKKKIFPTIFNKIFIIKRKDINCVKLESFLKIFLGNLKSFNIKNVFI